MAKNKNRKKDLNKIIAPLETNRQVNREVRAAARLETRPTQLQIQGEKRASRQQSKNVKSWYRQHRQQIANLRQAGRAATNYAVDQTQESNALAGRQDAANRAALSAEEARSAALRGVTPDSTGTATAIEAAAQRQNIGALNAGRINAQGQANANVLGQIGAASTLGRNSMLREERNTRKNANEDLRELAAKRADFAVDYRSKLRQAERDFYLQNKTLSQKDRYTNAINHQTNAGLEKALATNASQEQIARLYSGAKVKSALIYGKTQNGKDISGADINRASSYIRSELKKGNKDWKYVDKRPNQVIDYLVNRGVDPKAARMAVKRYVGKSKKRGQQGSDKYKPPSNVGGG